MSCPHSDSKCDAPKVDTSSPAYQALRLAQDTGKHVFQNEAFSVFSDRKPETPEMSFVKRLAAQQQQREAVRQHARAA